MEPSLPKESVRELPWSRQGEDTCLGVETQKLTYLGSDSHVKHEVVSFLPKPWIFSIELSSGT